MIEDFLHLSPVSTPLVVHLELQISPRVFEKNWKGPNGLLRGLGGNWFMKKARSQKSRDTVPLTWHFSFLSLSTTDAGRVGLLSVVGMVCGAVVSLLVVGVAAYLRSSSASSASLRLPGSAARRKGETPQVNSNGHYHHGNHRPIIHFF
jgi:hypothetical protein